MSTPTPGAFDRNAYMGGVDGLVSNPGSAFSGNGRNFKISDSSPTYFGPSGAYREGGGLAGTDYLKDYRPYAEARLDPLNWDEKKLREFVNKGILAKMPGFEVGMGMPEIVSVWDDLVKSSISFNQLPGQKKEWTPYDVLNTYSNNEGKFGTIKRGDWLYDVATGEKVKYVGPKTKTRTDKAIDLSSPEDVKAIATQALTELLGRAPNAEELAKFRSSINAEERESPQVTTTTETLSDMGEVVETSSVRSGGVSDVARETAIAEEAKKGPEYGKFQSATTYYNAMMQMISGG